jgi:hypothetical protein
MIGSMAQLHEYISVNCPFERVPGFLADYFATMGEQGDRPAVIELRAPLGEARLEREVVAHLTPKPGYPGYTRIGITWAPKDGGPYPTFEGVLSASQETDEGCRLDLDGEYTPPLGPVGAVFDLVVGHTIAQGTADNLLHHIRVVLEDAFKAAA